MEIKMDINEFIIAAKKNNKQLIDHYLKNGFNINKTDEYGFTAILESVEFGHKELFWYLVENNADITIKAEEDFSIIHAIGLGGDKEILKYVESKGISIHNIVSSGEQKGMGIKDYAIMANNQEILEELKKRNI